MIVEPPLVRGPNAGSLLIQRGERAREENHWLGLLLVSLPRFRSSPSPDLPSAPLPHLIPLRAMTADAVPTPQRR